MIECRGEFCGLVGFVNSDFVNHRTEIGYWLLPEYQRQGIMTRSVRTLCRWAVEARLMHRIQIRCAVENYSSNAIPRRLGFRLEGTERDGELMFSGEYVDTNVYSILDSEIISWLGKKYLTLKIYGMKDIPQLNEHNKEEYPPMHTTEHILNQTMIRLFGCGRAVSAHIERKKSKLDFRFQREPEES